MNRHLFGERPKGADRNAKDCGLIQCLKGESMKKGTRKTSVNSSKILTGRVYAVILPLLWLFALGLSGCSSFMANYYNRSASAPKNKPDEIIQSLALKPGMRIADLGAGGGYFTLRFARFVGEGGKVYAIDINEGYLEIIEKEVKKAGLKNIQTILAKADDSLLAEGSVDLIFIRNVFHHLSAPEKYFGDLKTKLKPGGRIAIVEYKKLTFFSFTRIFRHYTPEEHVVETMRKAGYHLSQKYDFLEKQSFTLYSLVEN